MKIKGIMGFILILALTLISLGACSTEQGASVEETLWTISVEGVKEEAINFTSSDAEKVGSREIKAILKKKDGSEKEQTWKGYGLKEVLEHLDAGEFSAVVVEAQDGYSKELPKEVVIGEGTILGVMVDGKALEESDNRVQLVINGKTPNWWVKGVAKIKVIK